MITSEIGRRQVKSGGSSVGRRDVLRGTSALMLAVASAAGAGLAHSHVAAAADITWIGTTADYNTPSNWSSGTVPAGGDNPIVDNGGTVLIQTGDPTWTVNDVRAGNGANTTGTYVQTGSTVTLNSWFRLGNSDGATGYYNESGTGSVVNVGGIVDIGEQNAGFLNVSGGALFQTVNGGEFDIAGRNASGHARGVVNVDGAGSTVKTVTGELWVGNSGAGNFGGLNVTNGASVSVNNWLVVGRGGSSGVLNASGGSIITKSGGGNFLTGDGNGSVATSNLTNVTVNITGGELWVGNGAGANGTVNVSGTTSVTVANWLAVGRDSATGTLNISGSASVTKVPGSNGNATFGAIGTGQTATINQTGGTFNNTGSETWVGENATGIYNFSGGTINAGLFAVGQGGTGRMTMSGTTTLNAANLTVGRNGGSNGTLNASSGTITAGSFSTGLNGTSTGVTNLSGTVAVSAGDLFVAKAGTSTGTLNITGGTYNIGSLSRGNSMGASSAIRANLTNVTLTNNTGADNPNFINGFQAGELNLNNVTIANGTQNLGVTGQLSGAGTVTKTGTGTLNFSSANGGTSFTGTMNISAGTVRLAAPTAAIPASSVAAFYPMNAIDPNTNGGFTPNGIVHDVSPLGNDLTSTGGTVVATTMAPPGAGHSGSLAFSNGGILVYAYGGFPTAVPLGNAAYTLGAWINLGQGANNGSGGATGNSGTDGIIGYGNYGNNTQVNAFRTAAAGAAMNNYWWGYDNQSANPNGATTFGNWHYVAVTYDPGNGTALGGYGLRTLYFDGAVIGSDDPGTQHNAQATNFVVGATNLLANPAEFFTGNMADLIIGTTAFTPAQLAAAAATDNPIGTSNLSGGQMATTSNVLVATGATLDLNGNNQTIATLTGSGAVTLGAGTLTVNNAVPDAFTGTITGTGGLTKTGAGTLTLGAGGAAVQASYTGVTTVNAGVLTYVPNTTSTLRVRTLGGLVLNGGTYAIPVSTAAAGRTLVVTPSVSFNAPSGVFAAKFDLGNGDLDVKNANASSASVTLTTLNAAAASGFAGGTWTGNGLASVGAAADSAHLTGVGVVPNLANGTALYTSFDGQAVATTDVLARVTYYGDTNLDGQVTAADYTRVDAGFVMKLTGWLNGDFNYDGTIDGSDYALMDNAFNQQTGGFAAPASAVASPAALVAGGAAVPEPTTLGLAAVAAAGLLSRRRHRHVTRLTSAR